MQTEIAPQYVAGLIDGEGYLALIPARSQETKNLSYEPVVKIGMCGTGAKVLFTAFKLAYGGHIEKRNGYSSGGREIYTYVLKSKAKVGLLIIDIIDHLFIKKDEAKLLLEFCALPSSHTKYGTFKQETVTRKAEIYSELKRLKQSPATTN